MDHPQTPEKESFDDHTQPAGLQGGLPNAPPAVQEAIHIVNAKDVSQDELRRASSVIYRRRSSY